MDIKRVACGHCPVQCGLLVYVEDKLVQQSNCLREGIEPPL